MKVLIACEFSGIVREAFRNKGHDAWSCDLLPAEIAGQHIQDDVRNHLHAGWDIMIAHPPCTHLAVSGARWFREKEKDGRQQKAIEFFIEIINAPIDMICVENPISIMSTKYRKPDQIIQPWMFGHGETKATCLWLKNLPKLIPTNVVEGRENRVHRETPGPERWKNRSRTYQGIADALALQYTAFVNSKLTTNEWNNKFDKMDIGRRNRLMVEYLYLNKGGLKCQKTISLN